MGRRGGIVALLERGRGVWNHSPGLPQQQVTSRSLRRLLAPSRQTGLNALAPPQNRGGPAQRLSGLLHGGDQQASLSAAVQRSDRRNTRGAGPLKPEASTRNCVLSLFRWSREGQRAAVPLLQQRGRHQLSADALGAVCSPEAHHGAASGGGQGRDRQPGPHRPGKSAREGFYGEEQGGKRHVFFFCCRCFRFTGWRIRVVSSRCRVTREESQPST